MAARIRQFDWSTTALGPISHWPDRLRAIIEQMLVSPTIATVALLGERLLIYNDAAAQMYGDQHPAALGRPLAETFTDSYPVVASLYDRVFAGETIQVAAQPLATDPGGTPKVFDACLNPVFDAAGAIIGAYMSGTEISERINAITTVQDSEQRFRAFVTASADVVYRMNADWSILHQLEGDDVLPDIEPSDADWLDRYIPPDDQATVRAAIDRAIATRTISALEHRVVRFDGSLGITRSRAVPIFDDTGAIKEWLGTASDVTRSRASEAARGLAEQRSRTSEARYLALVTAIDQAFCTIEVAFDEHDHAFDYRFIEVNPAFERQTGIADAEGRWMRDIAPDQDEHWFELYGQVAKTGEPIRFERVSTPLRRWFEVFAFRIENAFLCQVGVLFRDITDRQKADTALRESEERLRQFGEASRDVLWIRDARTWQWEYLTPAFETIYGLDRKAALAGDNMARWMDLVVADDRERAVDSLRRVVAGEWVTFEYRIRRPIDGARRWVRDTAFPMHDVHGRIARVGGVGHDITELKRTEDALAAAEHRQRALVEGIPQLIWRAVDAGNWTWSSPQWTTYTGLSAEQSQGSGWLEAVHPDDRAAAMAFWDSAPGSGRLEMDGRLHHAATDSYRWFQTRATPLRDDAGAILEWLGTSTDVDELRGLQERQQVMVAELQHRTRNLISVIRSIADKTGRASHDLSDFRERFSDRLEALGRVQGLLSRLGDLDRVTFDELIEAELAAMDAPAERIELSGPRGVRLRSSMVQTLAMGLHELATNAVKYGAMGQPNGRLAINWTLRQIGPTPWLHILWLESGVAMPLDTGQQHGGGQGRTLIERALPYQLGAKTSYTLGPDGVRCSIAIPVSANAAPPDLGNG